MHRWLWIFISICGILNIINVYFSIIFIVYDMEVLHYTWKDGWYLLIIPIASFITAGILDYYDQRGKL